MANPANLKKGPGPGRPKGSVNKFTQLRDSFLDAFEELGGTEGLVEWGRDKRNRGKFYEMVTKLFPKQIEAKVLNVSELSDEELISLAESTD